MRRADALETLRNHHASIRAFGVTSLVLFGSVARDDARLTATSTSWLSSSAPSATLPWCVSAPTSSRFSNTEST